MLSVDFSINTNSTLWTKENYIVPYIEECFLDYSEEGREGKEEKKMKDIARECLNIWDKMFEKQIGTIRVLSKEILDR